MTVATEPRAAEPASCATCRFAHGALGSFECRRAPPKAFLVPAPGGVTTIGAFPPTKKDNWCGAFERNG